MKTNVQIIKAFTQDEQQGNPAGIIFNADELLPQQMIEITKQTGFSECAFIQKSDVADYKVRFFSSKQEVDLCGHATIAFFSSLLPNLSFQTQTIQQLTQETRAGILSVYCYSSGLIEMQQTYPIFHETLINKEEIAKLLNISSQNIIGKLQIVSTGSPKLIIPIDSLQSLFSIQPDFDGIAQYCKHSGARGFYPYTTETIDKSSNFHARQFNPLAGINEDPITGIAAGALGAYIKNNNLSPKQKLIIEQGHILNKFGKIFIDVQDHILVGGYGIKVGEMIIDL